MSSESDSSRRVRVFEVGPRDGLQNEPKLLSAEQRIELVRRLAATGLRSIEIGSFVHPTWVPQMADTALVAVGLDGFEERSGVELWALVPNFRGFELAVEAGMHRIAVVMSATESHNRKNLNRSREESLKQIEKIAAGAERQRIPLRAYLSTAFGCPFEGCVETGEVVKLAGRLLDLGAAELSLGDTIGVAGPVQVRELCRLLLDRFGAERIALHLHDTRGLALTNAFAAIEEGVLTLDSSIGGLGGCPYAPGAAGNVGTEDLIHLLECAGIESGVDLQSVVEVSRWMDCEIGLVPASKYYQYAKTSADRNDT